MTAALRSSEIRGALGLPAPDGPERRYTSASVDSRTLEPGALFVALPGERHHGFEFLGDAARAGARGAIVPADRRPPDGIDLEWFPVEDPLRALGRLAAERRRRSGARVVGITGSSGKTTVREMLTAALSTARRVHSTEGNRNSQIGLPLTVLAADGDEEVWVLELGTSAPGEIARLTEIASPDDALITTVGPAHLERLGDERGVLEEKLDLLRGARPGGCCVVGELPPRLPEAAREIREDVVVAGLGTADYRPDEWEVRGDRVAFFREGIRYELRVGGEHHLRDALLAAAMAEGLGLTGEETATGLRSYRPLGRRGRLRRLNGLRLLEDCYNANPESFEAAIRQCASGFPDRPRLAVVGSMLELGERSAEEHRRIAGRLVEAGFGTVVATGAFVEAFADLNGSPGTRVVEASGPEEAGRRAAELLGGGEVVLVKGSRGAELELAVAVLEERFGGPGDRSEGAAPRRGGSAIRRGGSVRGSESARGEEG